MVRTHRLAAFNFTSIGEPKKKDTTRIPGGHESNDCIFRHLKRALSA